MQNDLNKLMNDLQDSLGLLFAWTPAGTQAVTLSQIAIETILASIEEKNMELHDAYPPAGDQHNLFDTVKQLRTELNDLETLVMSMRNDVVKLDSIQKQHRKREQWEKHNPYLQ